jgi:hypothetical protein
MKSIFVRALLFLAVLSAGPRFVVTAWGATTWYVATNGSDSNSGSSSAPFKTIQKAANVVNPGDTVIVRNGTYSNSSVSGSGSKLIVVSRGGTSSAWVTFKSENKWGAVIDGLNNTTWEAWSLKANYVRVQDFEIKGFRDEAVENYNGGQFLDIVGNNIHNIGRWCTDQTGGQDAIFLSSSNVIVQQNVIHDIGRYAPGENGCNPSSGYYANHDHGIYVDGDFGGADNITIRNNIFYNINRGWALHIYPSRVNNLAVLNNTFAFPNPYRDGHIIVAAQVTNSRFSNNIFYQPNTVAIRFDTTGGHSNVSVTNNITYQGTVAGASPSGFSFSGNKDNINPMLASPSSKDFRLTSGSPAINAGLTHSDVPDDHYKTARPQGSAYDIGMHEYGSGGGPVGAPDMTVTQNGPSSLTQGQTGASYTITAKNSGTASTSGTVTVTDALSTGLIPTGLSGSGWTCVLGTLTCTRADALAAGASYPPITEIVDVASNSPSPVTNTATVAGGGETNTSNNTAVVTTTVSTSGGGDSSTPTTWYVSPTGSDSNSGTSSSPFKTIQRAANVVNPGDTVIVKNGTYNNPAASGANSKLITLSRGGTASNWVTFKAENKWGAVIDGLGNTTATGWSIAANYIRVQNFEVKGFSDVGLENFAGGQYLDIVGNHFHDIARLCTDTTLGLEAIFLSSSNVTVQQNLIHDIGRFAPGQNGCNPSTAYYQNHDHGINIRGDSGGADNITIRNNIFYNINRGWAIQIYPSAVNNLAVLNNTFAFPNPWKTGHVIFAASVTNSRIHNNIFYQPTTAALMVEMTSGHSNVAIYNNITHQATLVDTAASGLSFSGNKENTDPLLSNPGAFDFHLGSGSPAINSGLTLSDVTNDYSGTVRPQGSAYDIGAYESTSSGNPPPPPPPGSADLTISKTHSGDFRRGQTNAAYTITVRNSGTSASAGTVTVVDNLPSDLTARSISGAGWTCVLPSLTCTRADALAAGASYPSITLLVDVDRRASSWITNTATVSGGGDSDSTNNTAADSTRVRPR